MQQAQKKMSAGGNPALFALLLNAVVVKQGFISHPGWYAVLALTLPALLAAVIIFKRKRL